MPLVNKKRIFSGIVSVGGRQRKDIRVGMDGGVALVIVETVFSNMDRTYNIPLSSCGSSEPLWELTSEIHVQHKVWPTMSSKEVDYSRLKSYL